MNRASGSPQICDHVIRLTEHLISGLDLIGVQVVTPRSSGNRSGIVSFSVGGAQENVRLMNRPLHLECWRSARVMPFLQLLRGH